MRSIARHHPLHPALAHFPLAFWVGSSASDLIALRTQGQMWWSVSRDAIAAGTLMGVVTLLAGLLELWLRRLPPPATRWVAVHASLMGAALLIFMVSLSLRASAPAPAAAVALSLVGSIVVLAGGYCGGTLVYRFGVGTAWNAGDPRP